MAKQYKLPNYDRADSQGLCFVGNVPMRDFLSEFIKPNKGNIIDEHGTILGEHHGAFAYTIGQRHGLGIGGGQPYFVYEVDAINNIVRVTAKENSSLLNKSEFNINDCVWWQKAADGLELEVRVRYRSKTIPCKLEKLSIDKYKIKLQKPERAIAPGQSAVFYQKNLVIGGGIIS
jgi:tRNA-specific 2-thiouridylase